MSFWFDQLRSVDHIISQLKLATLRHENRKNLKQKLNLKIKRSRENARQGLASFANDTQKTYLKISWNYPFK
jgi:hypothetical protein